MAHKIYSEGTSGNRVILTSHILPTSATMVGVCITVLGLVRLMHTGDVGFYVDKLLAIDSLVFIVCSVLSFASIRVASRSQQFENWAELAFMLGLLILGVVSVFLSFKVR